MASIIKVDTIQDQDGNNIINEAANTITIGASGDTITIPSGATFASVGIDDNATSTAITINTSGNVGIGTSSPSVPLDVNGITRTVNAYSLGYAGVPGSTSAFGAGTISTDGNWGMYFRATTGAAIADFAWVNGAGTERMRIDSSGNLLVGTTTSGYKLNVNGISNFSGYSNWTSGTHLYWNGGDVGITNDGTNLVFKTYDGSSLLERVRITSTGNVGIGTSSPDSKLRVDDTADQTILAGVNSNASFSSNGVFLQLSRNTTNNSFYAMSYYNAGAGSYKFRVADSGNVTNTNNSYGAISDEKLKENIIDATPKLEKLKQVRIVNFNFINDNQKQIGVIAQELENIFPNMVEETPDKDEDGKDLNTTTKQVKYSVFVPILIKALQEQETKIEQLEARITALETQP